MKEFGKRLRQPVCQRFGQDGVVVIVVGREDFRQLVRADSRRDGKTAEVIGKLRVVS